MRDELKQGSIPWSQRPWRKLKELKVPGQRAHLALKLALNRLRPCVVDNGLRIKDGPITLADDRERLEHIVKDHSGRLAHS